MESEDLTCGFGDFSYLDVDSLVRVVGREQNSDRAYSTQHPVILSRSHPITHLIIRTECL